MDNLHYSRTFFRFFSSSRLLIISFALTAAVGAMCLKLPWANRGALSWVDAWFVSVSAVCVTGLSPIDVGAVLTPFGKGVLLALIQVGGLGILTFSVAILSTFFGSASLRSDEVVQVSFCQDRQRKFSTLLLHILLSTCVIEMVGCGLLYLLYDPTGVDVNVRGGRFFNSLFISVSAFCNAGFSFFADNLMGYQERIGFPIVVMVLIVFGGVGFFVLWDLLTSICSFKKRKSLTLHTRLVLDVTLILIVSGAALLFVFELPHLFWGKSVTFGVINSFFQSVTARTAGYNTVDIASLTDSSLVVLCGLMFIGGAPGSTAGGVKVTTFAILILFLVARLRGHERTHLLNRTLPNSLILNAFALVFVAGCAVILFSLFISVTEMEAHQAAAKSYLAYLFEATSAFGTVGLSAGVTPTLTAASKLALTILMLIGRVGPLTILTCFYGERSPGELHYAEENVMTG